MKKKLDFENQKRKWQHSSLRNCESQILLKELILMEKTKDGKCFGIQR